MNELDLRHEKTASNHTHRGSPAKIKFGPSFLDTGQELGAEFGGPETWGRDHSRLTVSRAVLPGAESLLLRQTEEETNNGGAGVRRVPVTTFSCWDRKCFGQGKSPTTSPIMETTPWIRLKMSPGNIDWR